MKTLRVDLDARAYEIRIAPGLLDAAGEHLSLIHISEPTRH